MKYTVGAQEAGTRLDRFLPGKMTEFSRSQIQKLIKSERILLNGRGATPHSFLKADDQIQLLKAVKAKKSEKKDSAEIKSGDNKSHNLDQMILEDNDEFLVVNKPAGIAVHSPDGRPSEECFLSGLVQKKYPHVSAVGDNPNRPGIVHRLDKDVSGVMVIAKQNASFENLKSQFKKRTVKKNYLALVYGRIKKDQSKINFPIARSRAGKMAARPAGAPGKTAETDFLVKKRFINYTFIEVRPKTGRTHQIRCHLAAYGHPIVGDNLYGTRLTREKNKKFGLDRIFLAAYNLTFKNLAGEKVTFSAALPEDLKKFMERQK